MFDKLDNHFISDSATDIFYTICVIKKVYNGKAGILH